jgi:hypothetical protein
VAIRIISFVLLCAGISFAQAPNQGQSSAVNQSSTKSKAEIAVRGCVSRLNSNFILMLSDQSSSYQLEEGKGVRLDPYLGQEVEVTGTESPAMSTSSPKASTANPLQITVHSIKTIHKRCPSN